MSQGTNRGNGRPSTLFDPSGEEYRSRYGDRYSTSDGASSGSAHPRRRKATHPHLSRDNPAASRYVNSDNGRSVLPGAYLRTTAADDRAAASSAGAASAPEGGARPERRGYANTAASRSAGVGAYSSRQRTSRPRAERSGASGARRGSSGGGSFHLPFVNLRFEPLTPSTLVGILVVVAIIGGGLFWWNTRSINIKLNGSATSVKVGSNLATIIKEKHVSTTSGNLITVGGNVLSEGEGYAYSASVNGTDIASDKLDDYRASDGDDLTIGDGADKYEDYDVEVVEEQPKLEMGGDAWGNITYISQWPRVGKREVRHGKVSGETADGDWIQETQNCVVTVHQIKPDDSSQKLIALTFDDGPAETYTEKYIEILNQYGIHATFFNLGENIKEYPELCKKIVESGNELMSHTHQHQQLTTLDASSLQSEFSNAFGLIESTAGVQTTSFRPPYGDFKESTWLKSGGLASLSVLWNLDSEDWRRAGSDSIVSKSTSGAFTGAIILMHDGGGDRSQDVEALPQIIETLQAEGYKFVTVGELMRSDSSIPADIASGYATMPEDCTWPTELAD
ncbi:polysaccharide deacetylase family protein [Paratractidigestivibacter sp.]|uniref:polysaccharide deacetylase family protein n=1 Tax=Paratractidigestivibacter sp. TaxID=2847316 RepID=UPI002ACB16CF|nr:polysaccharide deacetylase family protein [Paratractidigestivibacter sp.]